LFLCITPNETHTLAWSTAAGRTHPIVRSASLPHLPCRPKGSQGQSLMVLFRAERRAARTGAGFQNGRNRFSFGICPITLLQLLGLRHRRYGALTARHFAAMRADSVLSVGSLVRRTQLVTQACKDIASLASPSLPADNPNPNPNPNLSLSLNPTQTNTVCVIVCTFRKVGDGGREPSAGDAGHHAHGGGLDGILPPVQRAAHARGAAAHVFVVAARKFAGAGARLRRLSRTRQTHLDTGGTAVRQ